MNQESSNTTETQAASTTSLAASQKAARPPALFWAMAMIVVVAMICGTFLVLHMISLIDHVAQVPSNMASIPAKMVEGIAQAFKPTVNVRTTIDTAIDSIQQQSNLVVLKSHINVAVTKSSEKSTLWGKLYLGTTTVTVRALDNRVQYIVPLEGFNSSDIQYIPEKNTLIVKIARPRLDEDLIEVQSDPAKISIQTDVGWARLDSSSGKFNRDQAMRDLRPSVIQQGRHPLLLDKARASAKEDMLRLLSPLTSQLREDVKVVVEFKE